MVKDVVCKSHTIKVYKSWLLDASPKEIEFVDSVYVLCEAHYIHGGNWIVEAYEPQAIIRQFTTLAEVKEQCGLLVERALESRCGSDDDPELEAYKLFTDWTDAVNATERLDEDRKRFYRKHKNLKADG